MSFCRSFFASGKLSTADGAVDQRFARLRRLVAELLEVRGPGDLRVVGRAGRGVQARVEGLLPRLAGTVRVELRLESGAKRCKGVQPALSSQQSPRTLLSTEFDTAYVTGLG